jgi:hypothetical protein
MSTDHECVSERLDRFDLDDVIQLTDLEKGTAMAVIDAGPDTLTYREAARIAVAVVAYLELWAV